MNYSLNMTHHARLRCQERNIDPELLLLVVRQGKTHRKNRSLIHTLKDVSNSDQHMTRSEIVVVTDLTQTVAITSWKQSKVAYTSAKRRKNKPLLTRPRYQLHLNQLLGEFDPEDLDPQSWAVNGYLN